MRRDWQNATRRAPAHALSSCPPFRARIADVSGSAEGKGDAIVAAMSSESYHEPLELLSEDTRNLHRAIVSLREELEAVDWYHQRAEACGDQELRAVITHNEHEEIEHAMMALEWIRRNNPVFDANITKYLRSTGPITAVEASGGKGSSSGSTAPGVGLGIGSLRDSQ
jgi:ferritin-like protein